MAAIVVIGTQWGDEGKGKVVDCMASGTEVVARFQGGANAGHTIMNDFGTFRLHLVPSGIFRPGVLNLLGTGTVIDTKALLSELDDLVQRGIGIDGFRISDRAQIVAPIHMTVEAAEERLRGGQEIGTTGRGIGPAYATKAARFGIQVGDLLDGRRLREMVALLLGRYEAWIGLSAADTHAQIDPLTESLQADGERLRPYIVDAVPLTADWVRNDRRVMLEGQLGIMRDLDWGIYPFVTSSNPTAGGASAGSGLPPSFIGSVIGVVKAYTTAVGSGPVPTEDDGEFGEMLRVRGGEYGATTGRPRRCGWLDLVAVRYACLINGVNSLAVTKMDVLDELDEIKVCIAYRSGDEGFHYVPQARHFANLEPVYVTLPGWHTPTNHIRKLADLPKQARAYLDFMSEQVGVAPSLVSVGPHRDETIFVEA